ncbi:B12-binding domain-containing radical SAM protein [Lachnotalea glycerini]|nr:radical SAM protein [Lachnotalea glycerini]
MKVALMSVENNIIRKEKSYRNIIESLAEYKRREQLWDCPNLGLLTIAGYFPEKWDITYIDLNKEPLEYKKYDWVFISASTGQINRAYEVADGFKNMQVKVAIGGIHASVCKEEAMNHADVVFVGEFEPVYKQFLMDMEVGTVKKFYESAEKPNLDDTKCPRYDLAGKYSYHVVPVQLSRGCPHACKFCASTKVYGRRRREKNLSSVEEEIKTIQSLWNHAFLFFTDDNMFINRDYIIGLLRILKKYKMQWYAFSDIRISDDDELLEQLAQTGCRQLLIGFESMSDDSLCEINENQWKKKQKNKYYSAVEKVQSFGIGVVGSFVLGFDHDNEKSFVDIAEFVEQTKIYATNITILTPFPGTDLYEQYVKENRIISKNWSCFNGFELTHHLKQMTLEEFEKNYMELNQRINSSKRMYVMLNYFKNILKLRLQCDKGGNQDE